jgi:hypothetical protein
MEISHPAEVTGQENEIGLDQARTGSGLLGFLMFFYTFRTFHRQDTRLGVVM